MHQVVMSLIDGRGIGHVLRPINMQRSRGVNRCGPRPRQKTDAKVAAVRHAADVHAQLESVLHPAEVRNSGFCPDLIS